VGLLRVERAFSPYGPSHWTVLAVTAAGAVLLVWLGRGHRGTRRGELFARGFAVVLVAFAVALIVYKLIPPRWNIATSLPLHLCDLAWMAAAVALWTRRPWSYSLVYYWGLTLSTSALITPALTAPDFPHIDFIDFSAEHALVVWAAVYLTWGPRMRPDWRGYAFAVCVTLAWGVAVFGFNAAAGTNYGFVNTKPDTPSALDLMGGWPWYLAVELVAGLIIWALITWPWTATGASVIHDPRPPPNTSRTPAGPRSRSRDWR
jgi:hypothetical integral membrane protein (TIGR02206 family)